MSDPRLKLAVFIDFDNVEIGVKTTLGLQFDVGAVLEAIKERGEIITKIAYGDWKRAGEHSRAMSQHAVRLVQRVMTPGGDKNGADINLALDALEMAFTHDHINAFVIVGGDSDFITLVEKLKQYDKKVFVVGGRAFTSQVMQKNCTEFIAYENIAGKGASSRAERGRSGGFASLSLDQSLPLVKRALKVLTDREVSPQLGLLKSTLLQLDSSFSERDYGASTFRDFAEKLEKAGFVTLKHSGRTTLVELVESASLDGATPAATAGVPVNGDQPVEASREHAQEPVSELTLADGVALVRQVLAEATTPPRWPMYLRQMKQFLRAARPDFDERRYGSLQDLLRACQKAGLVRLERDRQGGLRAFAGAVKPTYVPQGWVASDGDTTVEHQAETPSDGNVLQTATVVEAGASETAEARAGELRDEPAGAVSAEEPSAERTEPEAATPAPEAAASVSEAAADAEPVETSAEAADAEPSEEAAPKHDAATELEEPEDDQLAMFGSVRATDPPPTKAKRTTTRRRTTRKTAASTAAAEKPKRTTRKTAATRTPSRRTRS